MSTYKTRTGLQFENTDGSAVIPVGLGATNALPVQGTLSVTGSDEVNTITASGIMNTNINTVTAAGTLNVNFPSDPLTVTIDAGAIVGINTATNDNPLKTELNTITASANLGTNLNTITAAGPMPVTITAANSLTTNLATVTATGPLPVSITASNSITAAIDTTTSNELTKATTIKLYEKTMDTVSTWLPLTITAQSKGITIDSRANTTTSVPPNFDFAFTSTGSPFNRVINGSYNEDNIILPANTLLYFSVGSQTNSTIQVASRE